MKIVVAYGMGIIAAVLGYLAHRTAPVHDYHPVVAAVFLGFFAAMTLFSALIPGVMLRLVAQQGENPADARGMPMISALVCFGIYYFARDLLGHTEIWYPVMGGIAVAATLGQIRMLVSGDD